MNITVKQGRLTKNPELKKTNSGKSVCSFSIAVQRPFSQDTTDFFEVVAWEKTAENIARFFSKGKMICIQGYDYNREWEDRDGNKRKSHTINVEKFSFCESKREESESQESKPIQRVSEANIEVYSDDLPF